MCHVHEPLCLDPLLLGVAGVSEVPLSLTVASWTLFRIKITVRVEFIAKIDLYRLFFAKIPFCLVRLDRGI